MCPIPELHYPGDQSGIRIEIKGIIQGVGFRPFVYNLATRLELTGWVRNTSAGVEIEAEGATQKIEEFLRLLRTEPPPLAQIEQIEFEFRPPNGFKQFEIRQSASIGAAFIPISPDIAICDDCLRELFDPTDRRYLYPFINCTNCGPRFTIIQDIPYDRPKTTMAKFPMCLECRSEYEDPANRRFHAQPIACPDCGPKIWLETRTDKVNGLEGLHQAIRMLREGQIVAIKGLGGYHLACDATNTEAVERLRERKSRIDKPFALMLSNITEVEKHCVVSDLERRILQSRERPIVLLRKLPGTPIVSQVAPHQVNLGIMLPYTPLHYLLFNLETISEPSRHRKELILIMTSANFKEEPIVHRNNEAQDKLFHLADAILMHDRPIHTRCDDSVVRVLKLNSIEHTAERTGEISSDPEAKIIQIRRARGYAPSPILLSKNIPAILAVGGELKNTFCLTRGKHVFLSHHIGELDNFETLRSFEESIQHFENLFRIKPEIIAYDRHPDYLSTRYALARIAKESIEGIDVQHHHAHIVSCMAEHKLDQNEKVIGVAFDGTGYGDDGAIWGGEVILAGYSDFDRLAHLKYMPLPGGEKAIKEPWRMALSWLKNSQIEWSEDLPPVKFIESLDYSRNQALGSSFSSLEALRHQINHQINCPLTSSMGRLFDAVSSLIDVCHVVNYEAQASIELESLAVYLDLPSYSYSLVSDNTRFEESLTIDPTPMFPEIIADIRNRTDARIIASRFHLTIAHIVKDVVVKLSRARNNSKVVLSGGVWQNQVLLEQTMTLLGSSGFEVFTHQRIPCNDGGLAVGQAVAAAYKTKRAG